MWISAATVLWQAFCVNSVEHLIWGIFNQFRKIKVFKQSIQVSNALCPTQSPSPPLDKGEHQIIAIPLVLIGEKWEKQTDYFYNFEKSKCDMLLVNSAYYIG